MNVEVRRMETAAEKAATLQFAERAHDLPGAGWVDEMRTGAIGRFAAVGLPHRRIEDWKYTDLRTAIRDLPAPTVGLESVDVRPATLSGVGAHRIVITDGAPARFLDEEVEGLEIEPLEAALTRDDAEFRALFSEWPDGAESPVLELNTAFMRAGVVIRVKAGTVLETPVHLAFVTTAPEEATSYVRNLVILEDGASATFIESYEGPDGTAYQVNAATRFRAGNGARLTYVKVQREGDAATHLATIGGEIGRNANLTFAPFTIGAALSRNTIAMRFDGRDAVANIAGIHILGNRQHADTTLFVDHKEPGCSSRELFKSVLDARARAVFQGKILVRPEAQQTDGKMMTQALMLSDTAEMDNKPELEIYADDVQCGHGATTGRMDEDLLFYLRARGIPENQAQALLIEAFIGEAIEIIGNAAIGEALSAYAHKWVSARQGVPE